MGEPLFVGVAAAAGEEGFAREPDDERGEDEVDAAVEAMLCVGSGAEVAAKAQALAALDIDAIWWRDEASYTRPEALLNGLGKAVLPRLR